MNAIKITMIALMVTSVLGFTYVLGLTYGGFSHTQETQEARSAHLN